jgi:hypothetical protein
MTPLPKPVKRVKPVRPAINAGNLEHYVQAIKAVKAKPGPKCWCPACQKFGRAFRVKKSPSGSSYWAHEGCGAKMLPRKPVAKKRKGKKANLGREADRLWSLVVRKKGRCEVEGCPGRGVLQAAHGFSRRYRNTRWMQINGFALCQGCHVRFTYDPLAWDDYLRIAWGPLIYDEMKALARQKFDPSELPAIIAGLREELAR